MSIAGALFSLLTALALIVSAVCVAIWGNILVAIFLAVLWAGWTNNLNIAGLGRTIGSRL